MSNESQLNYCMLSICKPLLLLNVKFYIDPTTKTTVERVNNETRDSLTSSSTEKEVD